eukprot:scaffold10493_cov93-Cylindrotheca_fusiformis.AAC.5
MGDQQLALNLSVSPICDRRKTTKEEIQRNFVQHVVLPAFQVVPFNDSSILERLQANLNYWERRIVEGKKEEETNNNNDRPAKQEQ